jgi:hypothetical protein
MNRCVFHLHKLQNDFVYPEATDNIITLYQLIKLVQLHAAVSGACCIEKIVFKSIAEGINLTGSIGRDH